MGDKFWHPVGTEDERRQPRLLPGAWVDATGFGTYYTATGKPAYHTGADYNLNRPAFDSDRNAPVYAVADGTVEYAAIDTPWGKKNPIVVIRHYGNYVVWSRYAHVHTISVEVGAEVQRGQQIALIGNANGRYPFHLHFDIGLIDLGSSPGDWSGVDYVRLVKSYADPLRFIREV